jgi:hypothetical protein
MSRLYGIALVGPVVELLFPGGLFRGDGGGARVARGVAGQRRRPGAERSAAALASPQMPTEIFLTRPSILLSASIWMILAVLGQ